MCIVPLASNNVRADHEQFDEMYAVPESFLEIEVRNPMTHGELLLSDIAMIVDYSRNWEKDVYRL